MTSSRDPASYPAQFAEIVSVVYSSGQRARISCSTEAEANRLQRLFYGWRTALRRSLESKAIDETEREQLKKNYELARRIIVQKNPPTVLYFIFRDDAEDAKLLDSVEYE